LSLIRDTYTRFQVVIHEIGKFGVIGIVGTIITFGLQNALYSPNGIWPEASVVIATAIATVATFLGNRYWAFRHRRTDNIARETVLFIFFNVLGMLIQTSAVAINAHGLHNTSRLSYNIANVIGVGIATLFRLYCYRQWVFRAVPAAGAAEELVEPVTIP